MVTQTQPIGLAINCFALRGADGIAIQQDGGIYIVVDAGLSWPDALFVAVYLNDRIFAGDQGGTTAIQVPKGAVARLRAELRLATPSVEIPAFPNGDASTLTLPVVSIPPQAARRIMWRGKGGKHRK